MKASVFTVAFASIAAGGILASEDRPFQGAIRPMLEEFCNTCHSTAKQKGDLDLERFTSVAQIGRAHV